MRVSSHLAQGNYGTAAHAAYLMLLDEGSNSGVISIPFSTAFEMSKTVNVAAEDSQRDSSPKSMPETMVVSSINAKNTDIPGQKL